MSSQCGCPKSPPTATGTRASLDDGMYVCTECGLRYDAGGYCGSDGGPLAALDDPLLGTEIGRYRIARVIGQGGMGRVYLAVQPAIGSRVAVKVLSDHCARDPDLLERFFAEARTVNLIRHEHITNVIDLAQLPDGRPYIVMEFVEGQTLARATRGGRAPVGGVIQVVTETLSALAAAHAHQIVHRDLKPDNIIVTHKGHAKVLDFGIAKLSPGLQHPLSPRTRTGALLGTPAYMAPEQISGAANVDARTDIYAAGVVLFEALTGTVPFTGATAFDLMRAQLEDAPPSVRDRRPDVPDAIARLITRALAKSPADRFQTAAEMSDALHAATAELSGDQLRTLSGDHASLSPAIRRHKPSTAPSHTPPAFSAVNLPQETKSREVAKRPEVTAPSDVVPSRVRQTPWGWIVGALGLAGVAVAATVVVMSRDREPPPVATAPPMPVVSPAPAVTPPPRPTPAPVVHPTATLAEDSTAAPPIAHTASPAPAKPSRRLPPVESPRPTTTATPPSPITPPQQAARPTSQLGETPDDVARAELARRWNRHRDSIALPHEHPIARRPRVVAAPAYDATNVDYRKVVSHALAAARKELPSVHLVAIHVHLEDGRLDLTSTRRNTLQFDLGSSESVDGDCSINVEYRPRQAEIYFHSNNMFCNSKPIRVPTCSAATVWKRAGSPGAGERSQVVTMEFNGETWEIESQRIPDDC